MRKFIFIIILLSFLNFSPKAHGENKVYSSKLVEEAELELPDEAKDILGDLDINDSHLGEKGIDAIINSIKENSFGIFKKAMSGALKILLVLIISSVALSSLDSGSIKSSVKLCTVIAVATISISDVGSFIGLGRETLFLLSDFSRLLLPTLCTAAVSAGAITSAAAKYAGTAFFMEILLSLSIDIILPLISLYLSCEIASSALGNENLGGVSKLLKWLCNKGLILIIMAFTTYISFVGIITGSSDEMAAKLTKTALSSFVPVVGGLLSNTAGTLVAGAQMLRNAIGLFGALGVGALCLGPFLSLGTHYLTYKATAALSESFADTGASKLISAVGSAFGMILSLVGVGSVMMFISIIASMRTVVGT